MGTDFWFLFFLFLFFLYFYPKIRCQVHVQAPPLIRNMRNVTTFFISCVLFLYLLLYGVYDYLFVLVFRFRFVFLGDFLFFVKHYIIFVLLTGMRDYTTFTFCKYYLGLASTVQMPGEFRPILIWTTNVVTSSDEGQLVLPNRK